MSDDEGEKFWPEYWYFGDEVENVGLNDTAGKQYRHEEADSGSNTWLNHSELIPYRPSFPLHSSGGAGGAPYLIGRYIPAPRDLLSPLAKRAFQCPAGSHSCSSINRPSSCCGTGEICQLIQDTGLGDVGCCPQGQSCSGSVTTCGAGYSSCPSNPGGGCCIPGYECVNSGCALIATVTVTVHPTVTRPHSSSTSSLVQTTSSTSITSSETTGGLVPPARPTSVSTITTEESSSTTGTTTSAPSGSVCPTGFYACSAVYHGGCCRTGRNCDTTSCPITSSSTFTSDGRTIVVPAGTTTGSAASGSGTGVARCASGWFSCADTAGGGCCPTGFACGTSCMATAGSSATGSVPKAQPEQPAPNGGSAVFVESRYLKLLLLAVLCFGVLF
ncbi:hypothetical protein Plec18167_005638 [Paecilomyces lecythidis]|uniref:GPI anchored protein n=1 Tax=Paecilomyces lecythidis TaxID=3004212 RepID=A0ABR3XGR9_9EURO